MVDIVNRQVGQTFRKVLLNVPPDLDALIEEYRRTQPRIPSYADALRELVRIGANAKSPDGTKGQKPGKAGS
jgi:hypothetical protein